MITRCAICGKPVAPRPGNRSYPFCSDRCRLVDLGKWLGEEYRIPGPRAGDGGAPRPGAEEGSEDGPGGGSAARDDREES